MIKTALIQEQIDYFNKHIGWQKSDINYCKDQNKPDLYSATIDGKMQAIALLSEKRDQWQAILLAVEQQGKQEPVSYEYTITGRDDWRKCSKSDYEYYEKRKLYNGEAMYQVRALYASPVQPAAEQWQPIETAPMDGTVVDLFMIHRTGCHYHHHQSRTTNDPIKGYTQGCKRPGLYCQYIGGV